MALVFEKDETDFSGTLYAANYIFEPWNERKVRMNKKWTDQQH
jgi:hypothetical protein